MKKKLLFIFSGVFVVYIVAMMLLTIVFSFIDFKLYTPKAVIKNNLTIELPFINTYGGFQRLLDKQTIEDFSIFKNTFGQLVVPYREVSIEETKTRLNSIVSICDYCNGIGIPTLYLRSLLPVSDVKDLPYYGIDNSHINFNNLGDLLASAEIPVIDLNSDCIIQTIDSKDRFYYTDHHWSTYSAFETFLITADYMSSFQGLSCDKRFLNLDNYTKLTYPNSFLGSYGIKVGKYYTGKDDFTVFVPKLETSFHFIGYDSSRNIMIEKEGDWFNCLSDREKINDPNFNNKHSSWTNGQSIEYSIVNRLSENNTKVLLIAHSYGRPLAQYLSLCYHEVRQLDPQKGRFTGNFLDYIDEYKPDVVLFLVEFEGDLIGEYNTEKAMDVNTSYEDGRH